MCHVVGEMGESLESTQGQTSTTQGQTSTTQGQTSTTQGPRSTTQGPRSTTTPYQKIDNIGEIFFKTVYVPAF